MDAISPLKRAFGIDEVLLTIYSFLVGTDMNLNAKIMKLRLVSSRFNTFFISCMHSIPLQFKYKKVSSDDDPREGSIVKWLKSYDIATLFKLVVDIEDDGMYTFCEDFDGLDLSNLRVLDLSISSWRKRDAEDVFLSFAQATSLTSLELYHSSKFALAKTVYDTFLSYFLVLNFLEVTLASLDGHNNISTALEYPNKLEHLVPHHLKGNVAFRSESIKILDLSSCQYFRSIISIDCPSLEKIICCTSLIYDQSMMIAGSSTDTLAEQFGNTDKDYIADYLQSNTHHIKSWDIESVISISVVPMDYITGRNIPITVKNDCVLVLFAF